jgi:hypothetical protein
MGQGRKFVRFDMDEGPRSGTLFCSADLAPADPGEEAAALRALALDRAALHETVAAADLAPPLYQLRCTQTGSQVKLTNQHALQPALDGFMDRLVCAHLRGHQAFLQPRGSCAYG